MQALQGVPVKGVLDPELNFNVTGEREVRIGPDSFRLEPVTTNSYACPGVTQFAFKPNTPDSVISRQIYIQADIEFTIYVPTGSANQFAVQLGTYDAPAFMPLSQMIQTMQVAINSTTITLPTQEITDLFGWIGDSDYKMDSMLKGCPSALDRFQNFAWGGSGAVAPFQIPNNAVAANDNFTTTEGAVRIGGQLLDPFGVEGTYMGKGNPRGSVIVLKKEDDSNAPNNNARTVKITIRTREPLLLPPFNVDRNQPGLIGLTSLDVTMTCSDASRAWTRKPGHPGNTATTITARFASAPTLYCYQMVPNKLQRIPRVTMYDYTTIQRYETQIGLVTKGQAKTNVNAYTMVLNQIPDYAVVQVKRSSSTWQVSGGFYPWEHPVANARIDKIRVNYGMLSNQLAACTNYDLWNQSTKAGLDMSYNEFAYMTGSMVILKFGDNIPLPPGQCAGMQISQNLVISLDMTDLRGAEGVGGDDRAYSIFVTLVTPGQVTINDQLVDVTSNVFSATRVYAAQNATANAINPTVYPAKSAATMFGGSILGKIGKTIMKEGSKFIKDGGVGKVLNYASKATGVPVPGVVNTALKLAGLSKRGGGIASREDMEKRQRRMEEEYDEE